MSLARSLIALIAIITLSGCAGWEQDPTRNWSASQLYGEAKAALESGDYQQAVEYYELLEARFPFGRFAQQAQIEIPYAYYKAGEPEAALAAVDRFVQLNPRHPHLDYAYYLRGLINFNRDRGFLSRVFPMDPAEMDTSQLDQAFHDFARLLREFPDSRYTDDTRERMIFIRDALANHEVRVAQFYMERHAWVAAAQRARHVVEHYQGAESMPLALAILIQSYRALDLDDHADNTMAVLELNFPEQAAAVRAGRPVTVDGEPGGIRRWLERLPFFAN
ncbi:putative component of the lipoprotein assembly complex (forms a complex with YaeT, YfgL, and NlpB) [Thioalkalivibrio nitratireducens DSM 14787]|uniref:Outer membrane protein assembly factor BamD n=1 Tax=Thioalkalivibrio nitratireducens (strain DSM 14787 / UNIQEM 213 / ALEN2) TaxID=1255043 RepID=L0DYP4_THIND|nr:putative component of the lipoprotein assembly complex (forms a complex with YaeT, YfgL, and NlpB) [Thioalkalivibrio nitratireducens DSM 14787]